MANSEHVEVVRQGIETIAKWQKTHPDQRLDLRGASLRGANLRGHIPWEAIIQRANWRRANLRGANRWVADLQGADLCGADLREADLCGADLREADLCGADLREADLQGADLRGADLRGADLRGADLRGADIWKINLREAILQEVDLRRAVLPLEESSDEHGIEVQIALSQANSDYPDLAKLQLSEVTSKVVTAATDVVKNLEPFENGVIRIDQLLVVKITRDGKPMLRIDTLSASLAQKLRDNPQLTRTPDEVWRLLDAQALEGLYALDPSEQVPHAIQSSRPTLPPTGRHI